MLEIQQSSSPENRSGILATILYFSATSVQRPVTVIMLLIQSILQLMKPKTELIVWPILLGDGSYEKLS